MIKNYLKYFYFVFLLFFLNSPFAFALETKYPTIPGVDNPENCSGNNCLPVLISYWFAIAIIVASLLAVIFLAIGGIRLISSTGNPSSRTDAIAIIKGAILGLLLLMTAFLILRTINPEFIEPNLEPLPAVDGIFYTNGNDRLPAPMSESNTGNAPKGYGQLLYACSSGPSLFVWKFSKPNFESVENAYTSALECGESITITDAGSFKLAFETTGIYYCMGECSDSGTICSGFMSDANTTSGQLPEPFKDNSKTKSVLFVNNPSMVIQYGAVFHATDDPTSAGDCSKLYNMSNEDKKRVCFSFGEDPVTSVTVFAWNKKSPETSGAEVAFYSEPWGQEVGARAGTYFSIQDRIKNYLSISANKMIFNYSGINRPDKYVQLYQNFQQRPGSIYLKGSYFVELKEKRPENTEVANCQIFFNNIFNVKETEFAATGNDIETVIIIPIK